MSAAAAPTRVVVLGCGRIGMLIVTLLAESGDFVVRAVDRSPESARRTIAGEGRSLPNTTAHGVDFSDREAVRELLRGQDYVISAAPFYCNEGIATVAREEGVHYLDLTEDVSTTRKIQALAEGASTAFIPQCGLAPGFISIAAHELTRAFERLDAVKMRVGALPLYPHNRLKYNLTWSTEGLINEYGNPCDAIVDGKAAQVQPLQGYETFVIDGVDYEAFNTSGGIGTLAETLGGRVEHLNYKTIRYPGHRDIIALLMFDFKLNEDRETLKRILERSLPHTSQDAVVVFISVTGWIDGAYSQRNLATKIYHGWLAGRHWGAIQLTTAGGVCAVLDLHRQGRIGPHGFIRQEHIAYRDFIANRFGSVYAGDEASLSPVPAGAIASGLEATGTLDGSPGGSEPESMA